MCRFRVACVHLLPCLSLVTLNCLLFRTMSRAEQSRTRLLTKTRLEPIIRYYMNMTLVESGEYFPVTSRI